jgi:uncharacterized membrane protein
MTSDSRASWRKRIGFLDVVIAFVLYLVLQVLGVVLVLVLANVELVPWRRPCSSWPSLPYRPFSASG